MTTQNLWVCQALLSGYPCTTKVYDTREDAMVCAIDLFEEHITDQFTDPLHKDAHSKHYKKKLKKWCKASRKAIREGNVIPPIKFPYLWVGRNTRPGEPIIEVNFEDGSPVIYVLAATLESNPDEHSIISNNRGL